MILSNDKKSVFLAISKTGSKAISYLLTPYGTVLPHGPLYHGYAVDFREHIEQNRGLYGEFDLSQITYYAFWRDPVERFLSAVNYSKKFAVTMRTIFPGMFEDLSIEGKDRYSRWKEGEFEALPQEMQNRIKNVTPEQFADRRLGGPIWAEQYHYFADPAVKMLRYDQFESEVRKLIGIFGGDPTVNIPWVNSSKGRPETSTYTVTQSLIDKLKIRYPNDFQMILNNQEVLPQ
jgi:hypothetical protein